MENTDWQEATTGIGKHVDRREQVVEGALERIGEHERAREEGDAEHDREDGRCHAALVTEDRADAEPEHDAHPRNVFMCSRIEPRWASHSIDDSTVGEEHDGVCRAGRDGVVGDHHDRLPEIVNGVAHEGQDLRAGPAVEVPRRLVGKDDVGAPGQRPGHSDTLLLAAGQLARAVGQADRTADRVDHQVEQHGVGPAVGEPGRQGGCSPARSASAPGCRPGRRSRCGHAARGSTVARSGC